MNSKLLLPKIKINKSFSQLIGLSMEKELGRALRVRVNLSILLQR